MDARWEELRETKRLRRVRPSEHPHAAEIIALRELHAEHEQLAGRNESARRAQGRADRIRRLVDRASD